MEKQPINHDDRNVPQPIRSDGAGAIDAGPRNMMRDIQNPNILVPPLTDEGMIPNLRFSFSDAHVKSPSGSFRFRPQLQE
ncbi:Oxalate decarboxylase OxdD [Bacillus subtilis]|nr:Oxalate decarboxylase OxdD [Bacillus cereus]CUB45235.1 Oxalate decarboxylase OxdD [Bacillus subtilis]